MRTAVVRARPVALVLHNDPEGIREWHLRIEKIEANDRARVTPFLCHAIVNGMEEAAEHLARTLLEPILGPMSDRELRRFAPTYTFIRNFLYREYDADYGLACQIAHRRVAGRNRRWSHSRHDGDCGTERGWL